MTKQKTTSLEYLMPVFRERLENGQSVQFLPQGTSMLPMIRQGVDSVVVSPLAPGEPLKLYDLPLYQRENGQYVLHRVVGVESGGGQTFGGTPSGADAGGGNEAGDCGPDTAAVNKGGQECRGGASATYTYTYTCMGDNQFVKEPGLHHDQMIGVVTEFYRSERRHSVNSAGYKFYCRVWYHSRHLRYFWRRAVRKLRRMLG